MNSVLGIGENIVFINGGHREWEGNMYDIYTSKNEALDDFVFATDLFKSVRDWVLEQEAEGKRPQRM